MYTWLTLITFALLVMKDISADEIKPKNGKQTKTMIETKQAEKLAEYNGYARMVKKMTQYQTAMPSAVDSLLWKAMFEDSKKAPSNPDETNTKPESEEKIGEKMIISKETKTNPPSPEETNPLSPDETNQLNPDETNQLIPDETNAKPNIIPLNSDKTNDKLVSPEKTEEKIILTKETNPEEINPLNSDEINPLNSEGTINSDETNVEPESQQKAPEKIILTKETKANTLKPLIPDEIINSDETEPLNSEETNPLNPDETNVEPESQQKAPEKIIDTTDPMHEEKVILTKKKPVTEPNALNPLIPDEINAEPKAQEQTEEKISLPKPALIIDENKIDQNIEDKTKPLHPIANAKEQNPLHPIAMDAPKTHDKSKEIQTPKFDIGEKIDFKASDEPEAEAPATEAPEEEAPEEEAPKEEEKGSPAEEAEPEATPEEKGNGILSKIHKNGVCSSFRISQLIWSGLLVFGLWL